MTNSELFTIAQAASRIACHGASEYLLAHKLKADDHALSECINAWVKIKFPEAMQDAKDAIDCGMTQAAIATFNASMICAGIEAAKECSMPQLV
jgi:hypothetical protein